MQRRLNSSRNLLNKLKSNPGTSQNPAPKPVVNYAPMHRFTTPAPLETKKIAVSLIAQGQSTADVSQALGLSPDQIYKAKKDPAIAAASAATMERIKNLALEKTLLALGLMTPDKFENAKLEELAKAASSLSKIAGNLQDHSNDNSKVQFIVHVPQPKTLGNYKVIDV